MGNIKTVLDISFRYIYIDNLQPQEDFYIYFPRSQNSDIYINGEK